MSKRAKIELAINLLNHAAMERWGWSKKIHEEDGEKFDAIMEVIAMLRGLI